MKNLITLEMSDLANLHGFLNGGNHPHWEKLVETLKRGSQLRGSFIFLDMAK